LRGLGALLAVFGLVFMAAGAFALFKTQEGYRSLAAFSAAQGVELTYNDEGQLVDRGETAGAQAILSLLKDDWGYPVANGDLNPDDPLVNTASEYMYQMATVSYHTLHGSTTVVLTEPVEYNGETFAAGEYEFVNDGRYWTGFDRSHPIEGPAREQIWTATAHALVGELGVGTATASALQLALGLAGIFGAIGATFLFIGGAVVWVTRPETVAVPVMKPATTVA
jgi:hypothetical protein